jgi:hypothetical protein
MKMKWSILTFLGLLNSAMIFSQGLLKDENLGIVSYFTTVKYLTEYKMVLDTSKKDNVTRYKEINKHYNAIMIRVNRVINQLSADMIAKNSLKEYRNINKFVNKKKSNLPKRLFAYEITLKEIDNLVIEFLNEKPKTLTIPEYLDIAGIGTLIESSITSARDFREKKITNIVAILMELKLKSISELTKKEEPKK